MAKPIIIGYAIRGARDYFISYSRMQGDVSCSIEQVLAVRHLR